MEETLFHLLKLLAHLRPQSLYLEAETFTRKMMEFCPKCFTEFTESLNSVTKIFVTTVKELKPATQPPLV